MKTIVVGYDGTEPAERALARAVELAQAFGSKVVVADVVTPQPVEPVTGAFGLMPYGVRTAALDVPVVDDELWRRHRERVESVLADTGVQHEFAGVVGEPALEIVDVATSRHADLIVVGTREPGFLERLFGGSVSQGVARHAHCDVLVVHPRG
jgi:nucleotide-binding universal stress UspA family protein